MTKDTRKHLRDATNTLYRLSNQMGAIRQDTGFNELPVTTRLLFRRFADDVDNAYTSVKKAMGEKIDKVST